MPRHEDTRSPVGSTSSKRSHRDDERDRIRRDDGRSHRRGSRTRSPDRHYRDRDSHYHRDRSRDRYREHDSYRSGRRDRSRDRRRSRDRDDVRDDRRYRDHSRDRNRRRRDASADTARKSRRGGSRDRPTKPPVNQASTATTSNDEQTKKLERLAKLEAWKQKQAAERDRKQQEVDAAGGTRGLLAEIDKKADTAPAAVFASEPSASNDTNEDATPTPYAGKFDPKAIAKKAAGPSASSNSKLGIDLVIPETVKLSASADTHKAVSKSNGTAATLNGSSATNVAPLKARGNVSGFGLSSKSGTETEKSATKPGVDFGDDESGRKKLERLPTPPPDEPTMIEDITMMNDGQEDEDDDAELQEAGNEEEAAAAARAAAEKREERLQTQNISDKAEEASNVDPSKGAMINGDATIVGAAAEEHEEEDPLDAFMSGLGGSGAPKSNIIKHTKSKTDQPEALFGDDDVELDTVAADPDDFLSIKRTKKKDIPKTNFSNLEPFRKDFYHEPSEVTEMSEEDVTDLRHELDGIVVRGQDVPRPCVKWSQLGLGTQVLDCISKLGYEQPSAIQSQAIPAAMKGRDVIAVAKTGSGKTVAFILPMIRQIIDQRPLRSQEGPIGLVMCPTRELATQIHKALKPFIKQLGLRATCCYGGAPISDQIASLKAGAEIIVCTPGRLIELLASNSGRVVNLKRTTYVVMDEADRMFDMGFEPQIAKIMANVRPDRQTVLTSATFPRQMEGLARKSLQRAIEIIVGGRSVVADTITQSVLVIPEEAKFKKLLEVLGNLYEDDANSDARTLVFCERQEACDGLLKDLMRKGYPCMSIHGGKDQIDRDSAIEDFKAGIVPILIATSVAARGLDVKDLKLVVNYDVPSHLEDYVHRCGRTGRAGNTGTAISFITPDQDRFSIGIAKALRDSKQEIPADVKALVESFNEKVKSGKEKISGSGFGGKGLERLDQERDAARTRERKTYKTGDEPDEDEKEDKADKGDDLITKAASSVQAASSAVPLAPTPLAGVPKGIDLDGQIVVHKTEAPTDSSGGGSGGGGNPLDKVLRASANIQDRLSKNKEIRLGVPIDNKGPDAGAFHATLEINDFPQKARWGVTNRTNVAKILEATGTSITTKGSFYAAGKEPGVGENPKLYILVEGDTEVVVTNAMRELMRLLKEGTIAAADSDARAPTGRYNVV